jgi:hypothetical protein
MKTLTYGLGFLAALCLTVSAAVAGEYRSFEKDEDAAAEGRKAYAVHITRGERIKDPKIVGEHDYAELVSVEILAKEPYARTLFRRVRGPYTTIAYTDDVMYTISSWKKCGINMTIFLDEMDQTSVKLRGVRGAIRMDTHGEDR